MGTRTRSVTAKRNTAKDLREFAEGIETALRKGAKATSMQNLVCRHLTGKDVKVSAMLAAKWVEWMYGKNATLEIKGRIEHEHFDASKLSDEQLAIAEQLVESAIPESNSK